MRESNGDEVEQVLQNLLAQLACGLSPQESAEISRLVWSGSYRNAFENLCRHATTTQQPLPMHARAMVFKLADRLGMDPADLGMLK